MSKLKKIDRMYFHEETVIEHKTMDIFFDLLSLPTLIIDMILNNLDLCTLKRMRLVSKTIKFLIEHPRHLQKFIIDITQKNILSKVLESSIPWNNFKGFELGPSCEDYYPEPEKKFDTFICNYSRIMKHCSIERTTSKKLVEFLSCLTTGNLESLRITTAMFWNVVDKDGYDEETNSIESNNQIFKKLKNILVGLKRLQIDTFYGHWDQPLTFDFFLRHCPCLESILIPQYDPEWTISDPYDDNGSVKLIYEPLIEYLSRQLLLKIYSGHSTKIKIFFPTWFDDIDYIENSPILFKIFKLCSQVGGVLYNVPSTMLPDYNSHYLTDELKEILNHSVGTITVLDETGLNNIYFPPLSLIKVYIHVTNTDQNFNDFILNGLVKKIHANITSTEIPGTHILMNQLFQICRPTLKELHITMNDDISCQEQIYTTPLDISTNFPNLRKLHLWNFNYFGETLTNVETFNNILIGLPYLKHLTFANCSNLTDDGLLGMDLEKPLIVQLEHLVHLQIHHCSITNKSFKYGFKYLKLKTFYFYEERRDLTNISNMDDVTFLEGFSSLVSISNRLCESLEILKYGMPSDCSTQQFQEYLKKFKYLQKCEDITPPYWDYPKTGDDHVSFE